MGGTIQRSKVGGRVADSSSSYMGGTLGKSLYDTHAKQGNMQDRQLPKKKTAKEAERDVSVLPTPASVTSIHHRKQQQQGKPSASTNNPVPAATTATINGNSHIPSTRRSSSSARSKKSTGSGKSARVAVGTGASLLGPMSVSK